MVIVKEILLYQSKNGEVPFEDWLHKLRDVEARMIIRKRLNRIRLGNLGMNRYLGNGLWEFKIDYGPGYRIYYGEDGSKIIVLLLAGDKSTQVSDIKKAKFYWEDYNA